MRTPTPTTVDQIAAEKTKLSERLARLDADREKIATQLADLETAERVLTRVSKAPPGRRPRSASALVPGARAAGIAHFIDQQLSVPPGEALLEARILNVRPPYANFYRAAIGAVDKASQTLNSGRRFAQLNPSEQHDFVDTMRQNKIQGWQGPGGSFVYLVLRSDAVDVVYGTVEGYEALGIPYMPHIAPDKRW